MTSSAPRSSARGAFKRTTVNDHYDLKSSRNRPGLDLADQATAAEIGRRCFGDQDFWGKIENFVNRQAASCSDLIALTRQGLLYLLGRPNIQVKEKNAHGCHVMTGLPKENADTPFDSEAKGMGSHFVPNAPIELSYFTRFCIRGTVVERQAEWIQVGLVESNFAFCNFGWKQVQAKKAGPTPDCISGSRCWACQRPSGSDRLRWPSKPILRPSIWRRSRTGLAVLLVSFATVTIRTMPFSLSSDEIKATLEDKTGDVLEMN